MKLLYPFKTLIKTIAFADRNLQEKGQSFQIWASKGQTSLNNRQGFDRHFANSARIRRQKSQNSLGKVAQFATNQQRREARSC